MRTSAARKGQVFRGHPSALRALPLRDGAKATEPKTVADHAMRGELRLHEPMARHTSWRAGGAAERAYFPADLDDLAAFLGALPAGEAVHMTGLGSNLLVRDSGLRGTVIFTHRALRGIRLDASGALHADAGVASPKVARFAALSDLAGAEFLAGIPGTVGGALAMNAGCYGGETWDIVAEVATIDRTGTLRKRTREDYDIAYRTVRLKSTSLPPPEEWFVGARFALTRGSGAGSRRKITELLKRRIETQPLAQPNAGSVFRNPRGDYAARLIEACGLKGCTIGGAQVSEKHANFIVNLGHARAADIETLIDLAERSVKDRFGIALEREVRIIGEA